MCLLVCCFLSRHTCAYFPCRFPGIWLCMHCVGVSSVWSYPVSEGRPERQCPIVFDLNFTSFSPKDNLYWCFLTNALASITWQMDSMKDRLGTSAVCHHVPHAWCHCIWSAFPLCIYTTWGNGPGNEAKHQTIIDTCQCNPILVTGGNLAVVSCTYSLV